MCINSKWLKHFLRSKCIIVTTETIKEDSYFPGDHQDETGAGTNQSLSTTTKRGNAIKKETGGLR